MIEFDITDEIGVLRVNRPKTRNALNWQLQTEFAAAINTCATTPSLRALIITGTGSTFVAGGDIKDQTDAFDEATGRRLKIVMMDALHQLTQLPVPVIAAINGDAYGGGWEIVTACDIRVMDRTAKLHFVQAKMGLTSGWGGTARLVQLVGTAHALDLLLATRSISAEYAAHIGLATHLADDALQHAQALAQKMVALPHNALAALKQLVYASNSLAEGYSAENQLFIEQWSHPNHIEAVNAFLQKRRPLFNQQNQ